MNVSQLPTACVLSKAPHKQTYLKLGILLYNSMAELTGKILPLKSTVINNNQNILLYMAELDYKRNM